MPSDLRLFTETIKETYRKQRGDNGDNEGYPLWITAVKYLSHSSWTGTVLNMNPMESVPKFYKYWETEME